ncbi:MAG: DNA polymerase III subunit gamma/tau [Thermodesulfobacteriota bacterium]
MSYLVLARKWRPQVFEEVIGQRPITQTLQNAISQNRVAHAFLFTGARGVGKTSTARILAKALNCEQGPAINPCNQCSSCLEISSGTSMDVIEIDGASNRGIDEIRELRENVRYTPAKSRYKIYIIDEVHMLTREAFNALLKTLEEPPPHIIFVFATTEPHKIPATILSRCQRYDFKRIPMREILQSLRKIVEEEKIQISQKALLSITEESEGSLRDAQSLLDQVISYGGREIRDEDVTEVLGLIDRKILKDTIEAIAGRNAERCMEVVEQVYHYGVDLQHFCRELLQYLRDLILIKVSQHPEGLMELPEEEMEILRRQADQFQFDQLNHLFNLLLKGEEEIAQSTFPRTMLEMTLIRMATFRPLLPIEDILKRLEKLGTDDFEQKPSQVVKPSSSSKVMDSKGSPMGGGKRETSPSGHQRIGRGMGGGRQKLSTEGASEIPPGDEFKESDDLKEVAVDRGTLKRVQEETWRGLLDFARAKNPILGSFLALGSLVGVSEDEIEIGFEKDSFHYERIMERENRNQLESICHEYLQRKAKLVISSLDPGVASKRRMVFEEKKGHYSVEKPSMREERGNSLVQEALRLFDGKIVEG